MSSLESELKSAEENPNPRNYNNPNGNAFAAGRNNQDAKSKYDIVSRFLFSKFSKIYFWVFWILYRVVKIAISPLRLDSNYVLSLYTIMKRKKL